VPRPASPLAALALLAALAASGAALAGCGFLFGAAETAPDDAHVVWMVQTGCPYVLAKTTRGDRFALLTPTEPYAARRGDLLEGPLRPGTVRLRLTPLLPFPQPEALGFEVTAAGLPLADAQDAWRVVCPDLVL
jgi:hypothetical protein